MNYQGGNWSTKWKYNKQMKSDNARVKPKLNIKGIMEEIEADHENFDSINIWETKYATRGS